MRCPHPRRIAPAELLSPGEPARVFGASSGAIAALHLLTTRPERVERLVAHEPPVVMVLPDADGHRRFIARVQETFHAHGLGPAMAVFAEGLKKDGGDTAPKADIELPPRAAARAGQTMADLPYFVGRIVPAFMSYTPDTDRLAALSDRLVLAGGQDSRGEPAYRPAALLAERLGQELLHFPGGHIGLTTHPARFGELLLKALLDQGQSPGSCAEPDLSVVRRSTPAGRRPPTRCRGAPPWGGTGCGSRPAWAGGYFGSSLNFEVDQK